jgi:hypothetical protein
LKKVCLLFFVSVVVTVIITVIIIIAVVIVIIIFYVCYLLCSVSRAAITLPINCGRIFAISVREPMQVIKLTLLTCGEPWNLMSKSKTMLRTNHNAENLIMLFVV